MITTPLWARSACRSRREASALAEKQADLDLFDRDALNTGNRITLDILRQDLENQELLSSCYMLQEVLGPSLGTQAQLPVLLAEYTFRTSQDITDYLKLLSDLPRYFQKSWRSNRRRPAWVFL